MTEKIQPALSAEEWARITTPGSDEPAANAYTIALANAALPDSDPRKITWKMVDLLRVPHIANDGDPEHPTEELAALADALSSYLPPRA